ncbi:Proprotein convertase subtilisin/kexin type 5 [Vanrija pseudolonga]|uniref:Proprotein convertase subtilisin/kexin type 5 n=1 Tax=Vanrija pseudolonga TaxID=143232 RepID=A0AAF0Y5Q0_9TREE|nr:Proprotein convertase subtilisin/kexin type 5 [Vanrija pseudolonga]
MRPVRMYLRIFLISSNTGTSLIPGTYSLSNLRPTSPLHANITTSPQLTVSPPLTPVAFTGVNYYGQASILSNTSRSPGAWRSAFLPDGWYALSGPGQAAWGSIPDRSQLPGGGGIQSFGSAMCDPPCASGGICGSSINGAATCSCSPGFTGAACDTCSPGFFGSACSPCTTSCAHCHDGLQGSGACLGTSTTPLQECNCAHGTCLSSSSCDCAAGWSSSANSTQKCNTCATGFYQDASGSCLACPLSCTACSLQAGSNMPTCTSCVSSFTLATTIPATCNPSPLCTGGQYWNTTSSSCGSCSPHCSSCTGPLPSDCLTCSDPRVRLHGDCVAYDSSSGICDSRLSGLNGTYVVDNAQGACNSCPGGCKDCHIPGYSPQSTYASLVCTTCQDGWLLEGNKCVETCSDGYFAPQGLGKTGTCQACDSTCRTCAGSATSCIACNAGFASNGANAIAGNGTCTLCHPDCATCTAASAGACKTCPSSRPVLSNGRCLPYCPKGLYWNAGSGLCTACDASCSSCQSSGGTSCTGCHDGYILSSGTCTPATCVGPFAQGLGICLSSLVDTNHGKFALFALLLLIPLLAIPFIWCIRRERAKTRAATANFAAKLDERAVGRTERLRAQWRGTQFFSRFWGDGNGDDPEARRKSKLKELILKPKFKGDNIELKAKVGAPQQHETWFYPSPP